MLELQPQQEEKEQKITCKLPDRKIRYTIFVGNSVLSELNTYIKNNDFSNIFIIADERAYELHGEELFNLCKSTGENVFVMAIPGIDRSEKSLNLFTNIFDWLVIHNADRFSLLVGFGGGVIEDVTGFVAATFMRGIKHILIPTTLVGQVDSSIGGKVGINYSNHINMIGTYYNPVMVCINTKYIAGLPHTEFQSGLGEIVKTLLISNKKASCQLADESSSSVKNRISELIFMCCKIKTKIVMTDPEEQNHKRWVLNYGHTIGQAIETISNFRYSHGEAVALGMVAASYVGEAMGVCGSEITRFQKSVLENLELPTTLSGDYFNNMSPADIRTEIVDGISRDKKSRKQKPNFIILKEIGKPILVLGVEREILKLAIDKLSDNL